MITILGATGFVGSHITRKLTDANISFYAPNRNENYLDKYLGDVIYCIGMTADFRQKPFETVEAHVCKLIDILKNGNFNSLTYLSSTRVYINSKESMVSEGDLILISLIDSDELYTLTKLTGERICLSSGKNVKIARLSNVYGGGEDSPNFLNSVINNIISSKSVFFNLSLSSAKDYIHIDDTVDLILDISKHGANGIYNVSSGRNISNLEIINELKKYLEFTVEVSPNAKELVFPIINNQKIISEFNYIPKNILTNIYNLIKSKQ